MLTTAGTGILERHSGVTLELTQCFKNITLILLTFECLILCLQGYRVMLLGARALDGTAP